jgi:hypothetical protein
MSTFTALLSYTRILVQQITVFGTCSESECVVPNDSARNNHRTAGSVAGSTTSAAMRTQPPLKDNNRYVIEQTAIYTGEGAAQANSRKKLCLSAEVDMTDDDLEQIIENTDSEAEHTDSDAGTK